VNSPEQLPQVVQLLVHVNSESLKGLRRRMNSRFHWPGRGRYHFSKMLRAAYRPRPTNGSGDSPRPPFLTEFVNQIGKLALAELVYHLFSGLPGLRIHPHVERPFRPETEPARRLVELQRAHAQVRQHAVGFVLAGMLGQRGKRVVHQRDARRLVTQLSEPFLCPLQRCRVLIEPNQTTQSAEASCDFVRVPAQANRGVHIEPARPYRQKIDRFL